MKTELQIRRGKGFWFHMTNIPNEPWFRYWVLNYDNEDVTFTSIKSGSQIQAEHFTISLEDLDSLIAESKVHSFKPF